MEKIQLTTKARNPEADSAKKIKRAGDIPAVLYGHNVTSLHLSVSQNEFEKVLRKAGESTIIQVIAPDGSTHNVLIQDVQKHYLTSEPIHVDLLEVSMTEKLTANVPLEYVGESNAVKTMGGTLVKVLTEIEVECLPADLPHNVEVDISTLETFEDSILVKNLKVSDKVIIQTDPEETVATVQPPRDVEAELAEPVNADISSVEGIAEQAPTEEEAAAEQKE